LKGEVEMAGRLNRGGQNPEASSKKAKNQKAAFFAVRAAGFVPPLKETSNSKFVLSGNAFWFLSAAYDI
jgi:hypothetical protein